jgi:hypothetical protein
MDGNIFAMLRISVTPRMYPAFRTRLISLPIHPD